MKILLLAFTLFFAFPGTNLLTGRWETKVSEKGNVTGVVFKSDNKLEGYINKKPFVSGTYNFNQSDSTLSFIDNGCNGMRATYKVILYSNSDSLRFQAIEDSCEERRKGMLRLVMGRVK
ncbi:MAG TPA: hypothetical protein VEZ17_15285 [Chitinophagaceae bacterium]|jgi:hypothetical protein|nr:hypothetical protein [Chitinophagaceae bacterium]